jgi:hypothetical protein
MRRYAVVLLSLFFAVPFAAQPASAYESCVTAHAYGDLLGSTSAGADHCLPVWDGSVLCDYEGVTVGGSGVVVYEEVCLPAY